MQLDGYAKAGRCRQVMIYEYFGGSDGAPCGVCDVCLPGAKTSGALVEHTPPPRPAAKPLDDEARAIILRAVAGLRRPCGKGALARALRGSRERRLKRFGLLELPEHGALSSHGEHDIVHAIDELLAEGELAAKGQKYPTVWQKGRPVRAPRDASAARAKRPRKPALWRALEAYRLRRARELRWKKYMVFPNNVIAQLVEHKPRTAWELEQISGIGPAKVERFGSDILAMVAEHHEALEGA